MSATTLTPALGSAATLPGGGETARADALRHAAQEFEAVFLAQMLGTMTQGVGDDLLGDAHGGVFHQMLNAETAKLISRTGGIGIADAVPRERKAREVA